jgi:hypothetical protein
MAYLFFYLATVAACLLWTAAFTAAAARVKKFGWLLRIVALGIPLLAWVPWLSITAWLAFVRSSPNNWFGPTVAAFLSTLIGGLLIAISGRSIRTSMPVSRWPIPWLAIGFGGALLAAGMAMAAIEGDLERWASDLRAEVNGMVASVVPPPLPADANAASFYREARWLSMTAFAIPVEEYLRLFGDNPLPVASDEVGVFLKRQAPLIDLIRRATERQECRFNRDWSRPKVSMYVQETVEMRELARLLLLSARRQAVDGHPAEAIADVARLIRMGDHWARDPLGISSHVGMVNDDLALTTLAEVLPNVTHADQLNAIDPLRLSQASEMLSAAKSALLFDEAMYLNNAADIADKRIGWSMLYDQTLTGSSGRETPFGGLCVDPFYRNFVLRGDVDDFRRRCRGDIHWMSTLSHWYHRDPDARRRGLAESSKLDGAGLYSQLFMPAFSKLNGAGWRSEARRNIAGVLLAATRYRLATGALPDSLEALVPEYLPYAPVDVFAQDHALLKFVSTDSEWTVYSIGDNGRDDGGLRPESEPVDGKDDIGLSMKR